MYACVHTCMYEGTRAYVHARICTHTHARTWTYIYREHADRVIWCKILSFTVIRNHKHWINSTLPCYALSPQMTVFRQYLNWLHLKLHSNCLAYLFVKRPLFPSEHSRKQHIITQWRTNQRDNAFVACKHVENWHLKMCKWFSTIDEKLHKKSMIVQKWNNARLIMCPCLTITQY
jgi:hypothetical protein